MDAIVALEVDAVDSGPGRIVNRIMVMPSEIDGIRVRPDDGGRVGWVHDGTQSVSEEIEVPPTPVPVEITARQFLIQLAISGIITSVEALAAAKSGEVPAAIDAIFDTLSYPDALGARITWARMTTVPRSDPLFAIAGPALGLSNEYLDDFFRAAGAIP